MEDGKPHGGKFIPKTLNESHHFLKSQLSFLQNHSQLEIHVNDTEHRSMDLFSHWQSEAQSDRPKDTWASHSIIVVVARISISLCTFTPLLTSTATTSHWHSPNFKYDIRITWGIIRRRVLIPLLGRHTTTASHSLK